MTQASLLKPTRKTDAKYLRDQVLLAEQHEANAAGSAATATNKATEASEDQALTEAAKNQTVALKDATENLKNQAAAIVVSGDTSYHPLANQVPLARANGAIDPQWIKGALRPANWVEAGSATSGILIPDSTEYDFTAQMARFIPPVFIPETMAEEIVIYDDAPLSICITTDKKIRVNHYGVYESEPLSVNNDWVTFGFGKADNQTDTVTIYFIANGRQIGSTIVGDYSDLAVRAIFNEGAVAGFYGCASPAHQKQNSTATERIHSPGDPVGYDYDLSPNEVAGSQGTSTVRCLIGRQPVGGVRNLILSSEDITNADYGKTRVTTPDKNTLVESADSGSHVISLPPVSVAAGEKIYVSCWLEKGSLAEAPDWVQIATAVAGFVATDSYRANYNLSELSLGTSGASVSETSIVEDSGYIRIRAAITAASTTGSAQAVLAFTNNTNGSRLPSYGGSVLADVKVHRLQVEIGGYSNYQRVGDSPLDVTEPGVQDVYYHQYDLDDVLPRTLPAITDGTIIIGGTKGIWIDTLTFAGGTFSFADGAVYPGGPAGLYDLIGDLVGWFIADATLTTPQETAVVNWLKQKGCPGVWEIAEVGVVSNASYDTDLSDWGGLTGTGYEWAWDAGAAVLTISGATGTVAKTLFQVLALDDNSFYITETTGGKVSGTYINASLYAVKNVNAGTASGNVMATMRSLNAGDPTATSRAIFETDGGLNSPGIISVLFSPSTGVAKIENTNIKKLTLNTGA